MAEYMRTNLLEDYTPSVDETKTIDLPIRPISYVDITIKALNNAAMATLTNLLSMVTKVEVLKGGSSVVSLNASDLYALNCVILGKEPVQTNVIDNDNATRFLNLKVPFGPKLYGADIAMPATSKGELQMKLGLDIAVTNADGLVVNVEAVELPEAKPKAYMKYTTLSTTPTATGEMDVDLPIRNR